MEPLRIVFMGTPPFSVPSLQRLLAEGYDVAAVYTQPDRPAGRSGSPTASSVKQAALRHGLRVVQPRSFRRREDQAALDEVAPDLLVVAAYGLILPQAVLDIPRKGGLNVHPSLLPRHRGASPVAGVLLAGDPMTGVSIMLMDAGMDTGPVLSRRTVPVGPDDNAGTLTARLADVGQDLLAETIPRWWTGELAPTAQDGAEATYTRMLTKADAGIDWSLPAESIARRVRAYRPWPGSASRWQGRRLEVLEAYAVPAGEIGPMPAEPGTLFQRPEKRHEILVATGDGALSLRRVQLEGRRPLLVRDFLAGARGFAGGRLEPLEAEGV